MSSSSAERTSLAEAYGSVSLALHESGASATASPHVQSNPERTSDPLPVLSDTAAVRPRSSNREGACATIGIEHIPCSII